MIWKVWTMNSVGCLHTYTPIVFAVPERRNDRKNEIYSDFSRFFEASTHNADKNRRSERPCPFVRTRIFKKGPDKNWKSGDFGKRPYRELWGVLCVDARQLECVGTDSCTILPFIQGVTCISYISVSFTNFHPPGLSLSPSESVHSSTLSFP